MRKNEYPQWAEKYRTKGHTIRKVRNGYGLYKCTSKYVPGGYPKSVQEYLGMITEKDGFIPKTKISKQPEYLEYGLSHFIWCNFSRSLMRSVFNSGTGTSEKIVRLGIVHYIFGSFDGCFLKSSFISCDMADNLINMSEKISPKRILAVSNKISRLMKQTIHADNDLFELERLLLTCTVEKNNTHIFPKLPERAEKIINKYGVKYE